MKNTWFWIKFTLLAIFTLSLGLLNLPENLKEKLPTDIQEDINSYKIKLGIDLAGGTKLEYKVDFSEAERKLGLVSENSIDINSASLKKSEIAAGVVKTLKKRIDPDGTKEVSVFSSQRGDDWFVVVELTTDIDTEENRAKLAKVTSLEFKTPLDTTNLAKNTVENAITKKLSFDDVAKEITLNKEGRALNLEDAFLDEITSATLGDTKLATTLLTQNPEYIGWDNTPHFLPNGAYLLTYYQSALTQKERISLHAEKTFTDAEKLFPSEKNVSVETLVQKLPNTDLDTLAQMGEGQWYLFNTYLVEKNELNPETGSYTYSLIDLSSQSESVLLQYTLQETPHTEDSRFIRFIYFVPQPWASTQLDGGKFKVAKVGTDTNTGEPVVNIEFTAQGAKIFGNITGELAKHTNTICGATGDQFAIFVDNKNISAPCVRERINGNAQISMGGKNLREVQKTATDLAESLNSGATPAPIKLVSERKISASLGETALELSIYAALIGFAMVTAWIIFFFRFAGILAIFALLFYALFLLSLFKYFGFVLTLSGVAGVILSIGMAVDANVLIFERIKEELKSGEKFNDAVATGFDKAWSSIRDSNISSLITCFILFALGTSIIKAFAITLAIGILISMFTAITFTRYLIEGLTPKILKKKPSLFIGLKK
ncbi:TPA: protein translocase subunit SecD [Candidatus Gracilibacteria bacterium]|nr:protein translocase subunit SecD [Candidatus Peregrinibacteria bacterium]HIQ56811.1 protein translocase subunit SecD [Candidatus Gracilibacteria bacterium]HIQ57160.1 protein translocase subunit SecD [Candidatus Gracilibacteria bacterium]